MTDEEQDERPKLVKLIEARVSGGSDRFRAADLASSEAEAETPAFKKAMWSASQTFRAETGVHLYEEDGWWIAATPTEQFEHGKRRLKTARVRQRRGFEILDAAAARDPAVAAKVNRTINNATRDATQTATELRMREDARRRALMLGGK